MTKEKLTSYHETRNDNFNNLKKLAIKYNGEQDMHALLVKIINTSDIQELLKNKVVKIVKTHDTVYFLTIHMRHPLNKLACYRIFGNKSTYEKFYKNMPIVNYLTNRLKTLTQGLTYDHAMVINDNLKQHLITDKRYLNKKWYYAIGLSNSNINYKKFKKIIGHEYYNKDNIKQVTQRYSIDSGKV